MNNHTDLDQQVEQNLRAIWKGGAVVQPSWTADQVRVRARRFEAQARQLARIDMAAFLALPMLLVVALVVLDLPGLLQQGAGRIQFAGMVLLFLCSLLGAIWSRRYGHAAVASNADDILASHLERLRRLRDWYASTPWGSALYLPGATLVMVGVGMSGKEGAWESPIIWAGVAAFTYISSCIHMKIKARGLQREIEALERMRPDRGSGS